MANYEGMAISVSTRLGVTVWDAGVDEFLRQHMEDSHENLEARAGIFLAGTIAARPAAAPSNARALYLATNETSNGTTIGTLYMSNGSAWVALTEFAQAGAAAPGDAAAAGTAATLSRSDHKHSQLPWGAVGSITDITTAKAAGSAAEYARADHVHGVANNAITAGKIATGGVSATAQIADGIVSTAKIIDGAITKTKIATEQQEHAGFVKLWAGTSLPTGYLWCDGASYPTASYPDLFAAIGYTYGGAGANFNVPDTMGRTIVGVGTGVSPIALTTRTLGQKFGVETITLSATQSGVAAHSHTLGSHTHAVGTLATLGNSGNTGDSAPATGGPSNNTSGSASPGTGNGAGTFGTQTASNNQSHFHQSGQEGGAQGFVMAGVIGTNAGLSVTGSSYVYKDYTANENQGHAHDYTHTHTVNAHTHDLSNHSHTVAAHSHSLNNHTHTITGSTGTPSGSSDNASAAAAASAHDNIQPSLALNFVIKI